MTLSPASSPQDPIAWLLEDRGHGLVRMTLWFAVALAIPLTVLGAWLGGNPGMLLRTPLLYCELIYSALGLWYLRRQPQRAVTVVLWGLLLSVLLQCVWAAGIQSAAAIALPALLVVACFALPRRHVIVMAGLSMLWLCVLAALHQRYYASDGARSPVGFLIAYLFSIPLSISAALLIGRTLLRLVLQTQRTSEALAEKLSELEQSRDSFARLFQLIPVPLAVSTRDTGLHVDVNSAWCRAFRLTREQAIGRTSLEMNLWPSMARRAEWADQVAAAEGQSVTRLVQLRDADGQVHDMLLSAQAVRYGNQDCLFSANVDLTDRLRAEAEVHRLNAELEQQVQQLQRSQAKFATLFSLNPVPVTVSLMEDGTYYDANPAWEEAAGWSRSEALGKTSLQLGLWVNQEDRLQWLEALRAQGRCRNYQIQFRIRSGQIRSFLTDSQVIDYDGRQCVVAAFVDITERLEAEAALHELNAQMEQRVQDRTRRLSETVETLQRAQEELVHAEKLASLGSLVAGVAHELNTPIGNAVLITSTLADEVASFERAFHDQGVRRSELERFVASAGKASALLEHSLAQARDLVRSFKQVAIDQTSERRRVFELGELVRDVCETLRPSIRNPLWRLDVTVHGQLSMDSFPGPLGQVLTNLIQNAFFHGLRDDRAGCVSVSVRRLEDGQAELCVDDDGVGIAPEHIGHIFDPFFTTRLGHGGSGLGLNIVYGIVSKLLGGRISVESALGKGTRFTLVLPGEAPLGG